MKANHVQFIRAAAAFAFAFAGVACASQPRARTGAARTADCAPGDGSAAALVVLDMYAALRVDDAGAASRLFTPDFYSFDGGQRYTGPELFAMVERLHAAGKTFVWEVVAPDTHLACDLAWVTWENRGSITDAAGRKAKTWLESAVLRWADGAWRIAFFHSTGVPEAAK